MTDHYYTKNPQVKSHEEQMEFTHRGMKLTFYTDHGVFSKERIDFGSQLLIKSLDIKGDASVLDVGCGYGPIGLSLAKESKERHVTLIDVNERALSLARKNAQKNDIENVRILESDLFSSIDNSDFDVIVSNPPIRAGKKVVHQLFEESYEHLKEGGQLWIVIQKKQGAPSAWEKLKEHYQNVEEVAKQKGYRIFKAQK